MRHKTLPEFTSNNSLRQDKDRLHSTLKKLAVLQVHALEKHCPPLEQSFIQLQDEARTLIAMRQIFTPPLVREHLMPYSAQKLTELNLRLAQQTPEDILLWVLNNHNNVVLTTHFGPHEAAILHLTSKQVENLPVVCVDHGYNTRATYEFAQAITQRLDLNVLYYTPRVTRARREAVLGGVPNLDNPKALENFTEEVKLEPFRRAFAELKPQVWLTSIRKEQTAHRASLDILSIDQNTGCLKVAPFFHYSELDMEEYLVLNDLPFSDDYYDPTKVLAHRECGLHLS